MIVRSRQTKVIASLLAASLLASCAPKVKSTTYPESQTVFETSLKDSNLSVEELGAEDLLKHLSAEQQMKTGELFRSVRGLYLLANSHDRPALKTLADGINEQFYTSVNTTAKVRFEKSPIVQAALGYGKQYADLAGNLLNLIEGSVKAYPWPANVKFADYQIESQKYFSWLISQVRIELKAKKISVSDESIAEVEAPILELFNEQQAGFNEAVAGIQNADSAATMISNLSDFYDTLGLDISEESLSELAKIDAAAQAIAPKIDAITNKASAKAVIDELKSILSADEITAIEAISKTDAIKLALTKSVADSVLRATESAAAKFTLPQLPNQLLQLGSTKIGIELDQIKAIAADPKDFIKKLAAQFGENQLASAPAGITGIESSEIDVVFQSNNLKISGKKTKELKTSAEAIGASLSNSIAQVIESDKSIGDTATDEEKKINSQQTNALLVSQLNKLVLLGGFKTEDNNVASYTTSQDQDSTPVEVLNQKATSNTVSAVSDELVVARNLTPVSTAKNVSVRGQAALLQGLSDTIAYLRDWKKSGFEDGLGAFTIANALKLGSVISEDSEVTEGPLAMKIFDKSTMFAFAIANAAAVLQNTKKDGTPFYLVSPTETAEWLNEPSKNSLRATAGIVDIVNGRRTAITRIGDVARYILAISSFLEATNGIEKTKSNLLKAQDEKTGRRKLDDLLEAREQLKMLLTALANMLSGTLQHADGSFAAQFNKSTRKTSGKASAVDAALAVEALVKVANEFGARVYSTAALEGYFAMNRTLWNSDLKFYAQEAGKNIVPTYNELVSIINSIDTLAPHMPSNSRAQWQTIAQNWAGALELLANNLEAAKK